MSSTAAFQPAGVVAPQPAATEAQFEYQRFDVYRVALEFQALVPGLFPRRGYASLRDQLDRASASILLNRAEGSGHSSRASKAQFYLIARGSAMESAAVLDVLLTRGVIPAATHRPSACVCDGTTGAIMDIAACSGRYLRSLPSVGGYPVI